MTRSAEVRNETALLAVLLVADALFYAVVIPLGIPDPAGFGLDEGLPPSFPARVASALLALIMVLRLAKLWLLPRMAEIEGSISAEDGDGVEDPIAIGVRNVIGIACALLFAYLLVPVVGFYVSGFLLLAALMRTMGETRVLVLFWQPALIVGLIWGLFDRIFSINMPAGVLFGG